MGIGLDNNSAGRELSLHVKGWVVLSHANGWVVIAHVKVWVVYANAKGWVVLRTTLSLTWDDNPPPPPIFHGVNVTTFVKNKCTFSAFDLFASTYEVTVKLV